MQTHLAVINRYWYQQITIISTSTILIQPFTFFYYLSLCLPDVIRLVIVVFYYTRSLCALSNEAHVQDVILKVCDYLNFRNGNNIYIIYEKRGIYLRNVIYKAKASFVF